MSWVWENTVAEGAELLVLLALADHAADDGTCYPSMTRIAARGRLSLRGAQTAVRSLESKGFITTHLNSGPKGCNRYRVNMVTPATSTPPQHLHPADNDRGGANGGTLPPQHLHPKHQEPSRNRNTPLTPLAGGLKQRRPTKAQTTARVGMYDGPQPTEAEWEAIRQQMATKGQSP